MLSEIDFGAGTAPWYQRSSTIAGTPLAHFSPANGFPVASYEQFFQTFGQKLSFTGMDSRGAWPAKKPPNNFSNEDFAEDLITAIESQHAHPVIGMGHSHGGLITMVAANQRPELFSKLVIIEPASAPDNVFGRLCKHVPKWLLLRLIPFIRGSHERRKIWPSRQVFYDHYHGHPTFKYFSDAALHDYAKHGLRKRDDGQFELIFQPEWESHIFCRVGTMWPYLAKVTHPTLVIRAEHSSLYTAAQFATYNAKLGHNVTALTLKDAHHLVTHEDPIGASRAIQEWLDL